MKILSEGGRRSLIDYAFGVVTGISIGLLIALYLYYHGIVPR